MCNPVLDGKAAAGREPECSHTGAAGSTPKAAAGAAAGADIVADRKGAAASCGCTAEALRAADREGGML